MNGHSDFMFILANLEATTRLIYMFVTWGTDMKHPCAFPMEK